MASGSPLSLIIRLSISAYHLANQVMNTTLEEFDYLVLTNIFVRYSAESDVLVLDSRSSLSSSTHVFQNEEVVS